MEDWTKVEHVMTFDSLYNNGKIIKFGPLFSKNPSGLFEYVCHYWVASKQDGVLACSQLLDEADAFYETHINGLKFA